jgi:hypothetical protein
LRRGSERGQALIIIVFAILGLMGVVGLAVDGGNIYLDRIRAQNTADTVALNAALQRINNQGNWLASGFQRAAESGYANDGRRSIVEINSPPGSGKYRGNIEYIQVIITSNVRTYLAGAIGIGQLTNRVEAISRTKPARYEPMLGGAAVVSLAPASECDRQRAFWVHGEATLDISNSGIFVNSGNPHCALITEANGSIRIDNGRIAVVGGASVKKPKLLTPYPPDIGATPIAFPNVPFFMPKVGCSHDAKLSLDGHTLYPGSWNDPIFPPKGVNILESGVYCVNGDFILNSKDELEGNGVVIKVEHGRVQFAGGATYSLHAPTSGKLAGLLLYLPLENTSKVQLNGSSEATLAGAILAPGAEVHLNGYDNPAGWKTQIIGYTVDVDGDSNIVIKYIDDQIYDALSFPEVQFIK